MAGIYIHVPFCKSRCIYCDFYSTTLEEERPSYVNSLCRELEERKDYLSDEPIETLYFGGGTPSQLSADEFRQVFGVIERIYGLSACEEITLEANPDDLTDDYLSSLAELPFNRISMGVQTFNNELLSKLRRRHTSVQAIEAVQRCRKYGFKNISIDLMYGLPEETEQQWLCDLKQAIDLNVEHISAYHLIYEEGTPLFRMQQEKDVQEVDEEMSLSFFRSLIRELKQSGYEHYEISNFCLPNKHSRHNSSYWRGIPYLGCGPSAHSYNGRNRQWNVASLKEYIEKIQNGQSCFELETLSTATRYNELVMTSLRTMWGLSLSEVDRLFGFTYRNYCLKMAKKHLLNGKLLLEGDILRLSEEGIFISDSIMSDLLQVD